ncbi:MAG TPA: hypothetical protein VNV36_06060 [Pseudomonas sp.]|uniref:hypothetical protein n=1 Tax=Pseudomonas sp. TaxID=306 RepID=UPI002CE6BE5B|nr:hypothetical protein [Pseudomonas sp.]HWH86322.1 hypothetical protein [Pseudomonas sp.]
MRPLNKKASQVALPLPSSSEWLRLLRTEAELQTITGAAKRIGCARSKVSMLLSGKYPAKTVRAERQVLRVLGSVQCPVLDGETMEGSCCQAHRLRAAGTPPTNNSTAILYWRSCQVCPNNGAIVISVRYSAMTYVASNKEQKATASNTISAEQAAVALLRKMDFDPELLECVSSSESKGQGTHTFIYREVQ